MLSRIRSDSGFSLIEVMASILIFAIVTLGITPLMISSIRGAATVRSETVAKNLAQRAMERARGLPFFESVRNETTPRRRDVLDLYFPDVATGYNATTGIFTTTCTATGQVPNASAALGCAKDVPPGFTLSYRARFVTTNTAVSPNTFVTQAPPTTYNWTSVSTESPPSNLLELATSVSWVQAGNPRDFTLTTLMSDRKLAPDNYRASSRLDYVIQASTTFRESSGTYAGRVSRLNGFVGIAESSIENRAVASADQTVRAGRMVLTRDEFGDPVITPSASLSDLVGASRILHSGANFPPSSTNEQTSAALQITHPDLASLGPISYLDANRVIGTSTGTQITNQLPAAQGGFEFTSGVGASPTFWMTNQRESSTSDQVQLYLDPNQKIFTVTRSGPLRLSGASTAVATALAPAASRKVEATATGSFAKMVMFPTTFISHSDASVLKIENFRAEITCRSTANAGTAIVMGDWEAEVSYWRDPVNDGSFLLGIQQLGRSNGAYARPGGANTKVTGSLTAPTTDIFSTIGNPLVYDDAVDVRDVYLFKTGSPSGRGYFDSITSSPRIESTKSPDGRVTSVTIKNALQIVTDRTDPNNAESSLTVNIGSLSCEAVDRRGL